MSFSLRTYFWQLACIRRWWRYVRFTANGCGVSPVTGDTLCAEMINAGSSMPNSDIDLSAIELYWLQRWCRIALSAPRKTQQCRYIWREIICWFMNVLFRIGARLINSGCPVARWNVRNEHYAKFRSVSADSTYPRQESTVWYTGAVTQLALWRWSFLSADDGVPISAGYFTACWGLVPHHLRFKDDWAKTRS